TAVRLSLRSADLLRLLRLHRHRTRSGAALRLSLAGQFQLAVSGDLGAGLLAALAHDAVAVPEGLSLRAAGWQPAWLVAHQPQSDADDALGRLVARRELVVSAMGRHPRRHACHSPLLAVDGGERMAAPANRLDTFAMVGAVPGHHLPRRLPGVVLLPADGAVAEFDLRHQVARLRSRKKSFSGGGGV